MMTDRQLTIQDAEFVLKLYDLRRESVMRESRKRLMRDFWPQSLEEIRAVMTNYESPLNEAFRQVTSYYEMVYGFARKGIIDANFLSESNAEGLFIYAKIAAHIAEIRKEVSPTAFSNTEWIVSNSEVAQARFALFQQRVAAMLQKNTDPMP